MANKITKRDRFETLLTLDSVTEIPGMTDWIYHEIELLNKKNAKSGELTKKQAENAVIQEEILALMEDGTLYTITQIQKDLIPEKDLSNQKLTHLLTPMVEDGRVIRKEIKRRAYYAKASEETEEEGV